MAFEGLSNRLQETIKKITGKGKVSEQDVKEMTREVRLALLEADVNFKVVKDLINRIKERAVGQEVMESLTPGQQVIKVVKEELTTLMGGEQSKIAVADRPPTVIMMVGLQGAGKTTTTGKLANFYVRNITVHHYLLLVTSTVQQQFNNWKHWVSNLRCLCFRWERKQVPSKLLQKRLSKRKKSTMIMSSLIQRVVYMLIMS